MVILSKIVLLFNRIYERVKTCLIWLEANNASTEETVRFNNAFIAFHCLLAGFGWCVVNNFFWKSSGPYIDLPNACASRSNLKNLYEPNFLFDLHAYLSENETAFDESQPIWLKQKWVYGDAQWAFTLNTNVSTSEVGDSIELNGLQNN